MVWQVGPAGRAGKLTGYRTMDSPVSSASKAFRIVLHAAGMGSLFSRPRAAPVLVLAIFLVRSGRECHQPGNAHSHGWWRSCARALLAQTSPSRASRGACGNWQSKCDHGTDGLLIDGHLVPDAPSLSLPELQVDYRTDHRALISVGLVGFVALQRYGMPCRNLGYDCSAFQDNASDIPPVRPNTWARSIAS